MRLSVTVISLSFFLLATGTPALAHHSLSAEFNPNKAWTATGMLSKIDWVNPHTVTWIDMKDDKTGKVVKVGCEGNPPGTYHRAGLNKSDWKIGQEVTITCASAKDGTPYWGFLKEIRYLSDGHVLMFRIGGE